MFKSVGQGEEPIVSLPTVKEQDSTTDVDPQNWMKNLPINNDSRVCSAHFVSSTGSYLRPDEYPTLNLPVLTTPIRKRKSPKHVSFFLLILLIQAMMTQLVHW